MAKLHLPQTVAIVIPWFGVALKGGAEQQAWQIATRLAARGHMVEVLTTCCRSFFDNWAENHLPAGESREAGLTIRRFPVETRDHPAFNELNRELLEIPNSSLLPGVSPVDHQRAKIWTRENINSQSLESYLIAHKSDYHAFIFLPYLYGVILRGLPLVADRAWLQPCLHDEAYAYLPDVAHIFYQARGLLFNSAGEMQLAGRLYGPMIFCKGEAVGEGIELDTLADDHQADLPTLLANRRFALCLGRRDAGKGTDRLVAAFRAFRLSKPSSKLQLVLAGPGERSYGDEANGIIDLGLVSEVEKAAVLQSCVALLQPSTNESFSRVLFEAWACGKPVVAHRDCLATAMAVTASGGGWVAGTEGEWISRLAYLDVTNSKELKDTGEKGREYADNLGNWERVMPRYESMLGLGNEEMSSHNSMNTLKTIHQLLPDIADGDAISNAVLSIRDRLHSKGVHSEIFASNIHLQNRDRCHIYKEGLLKPDDGLIYHHSIGTEITLSAIAHPGNKCLIYHNITPAEFFRPYRPEFSALLRDGREQMWWLAKEFCLSVGDSTYNAEELALYGFRSPRVLPLLVDPRKWNMPPDENLMRELQDGKHNLLFVGRYAPNKCQHHLVEAFAHYHSSEPESRLVLVGSGEPNDPYVRYLQQSIDHFGVREHVIMPGHISNAQLHAYYRTANLFWSMSEHEGFCVPIIEAMWFDIPVLAFRSSAIPGTLRDGGMMFTEKARLSEVAALAQSVLSDAALRNELLARQRHVRNSHLEKNLTEAFDELLTRLSGV